MDETYNEELLKRINPGLLGIKPYLPGRPVQELVRERGGSGYIKMASNENPLGMSPKAARAIREHLEECFQYPELSGPELRLSLGQRLTISPENILLGNGADGILYTYGLSLIDQGDEVIIPEITFSLYETIARGMRARIVFSRMKGYDIDLEDILRKIGPKSKLIFLCNPNNPTGALLDREQMGDFLEALPEHVFLVHDEVYHDFAPREAFPDLLEPIRRGSRNLLIARSFSKIYGLAGIRVGYGIASRGLIDLMYRIRPPFDISIPAQVAGMAALEDEQFYERTLELTRREKEIFCRRLEEMGLSYVPSSTNFVLVDVGEKIDRINERLLQQGFIVRCGFSGLPTHIRITLGTPDQNRRLLAGLQGILEEIR